MVSFIPFTRNKIMGRKINLGLILKLALLLKTNKKETIANPKPSIFNRLKLSFAYNKAPIKTGITTDILLEIAVIATPTVCEEYAKT
jgi:hypothetical protein